MHPRLMFVANSSNHGGGYLGHAIEKIASLFQGTPHPGASSVHARNGPPTPPSAGCHRRGLPFAGGVIYAGRSAAQAARRARRSPS